MCLEGLAHTFIMKVVGLFWEEVQSASPVGAPHVVVSHTSLVMMLLFACDAIDNCYYNLQWYTNM